MVDSCVQFSSSTGDPSVTGASSQAAAISVQGSAAVLVFADSAGFDANIAPAVCTADADCALVGASIDVTSDSNAAAPPPMVVFASAEFGTDQQINATLARVVVVDSTFKDGAAVLGREAPGGAGGAYTCDQPPPQTYFQCTGATCAAAGVDGFGYACTCQSGYTRQNATLCTQ